MMKNPYSKEQEAHSAFLSYLRKCNCTEDEKMACSNFQPVVARVKIVEALDVPELKDEVSYQVLLTPSRRR
jgi:glutamyl/glutaminyl-tRNA synthetase